MLDQVRGDLRAHGIAHLQRIAEVSPQMRTS
jgi:hypothetical protein